jgi:TonB family protein
MIVAALFSSLVQGCAIAAITYLAVRCVPERNAATRCALWFVALLALLFIPVLTVASDAGAQLLAALRPSAGPGAIVVSLLPVGTLAHQATRLAAPAGLWILSLWLIGVTAQSARLAVSFLRVEGIRRGAEPSGIDGGRVLVSAEIAIPIAAGLFDPVVIIPKRVADTLARGDLARVVAHERAHLARNDIAGNLVQRAIEAILFFNPWAHLIGRQISNEREAACDDVAVQRTGTAGDYVKCLASLAQSISARQAALLTPSALRSRRSVVARIERLARNGAPGATSLNYYSIGGTIMILALLTLALQALSPASTVSANAPAMLQSTGSRLVASACSVPNAAARVVTPAEPQIPHSAGPVHGFVNIGVTISPSGQVAKAVVEHSSGIAAVDAAVLKAAKASTYSPARKDCAPVAGEYIFHAEFEPNP